LTHPLDKEDSESNKDMLADGSGAVAAMVLFYLRYRKATNKILNSDA